MQANELSALIRLTCGRSPCTSSSWRQLMRSRFRWAGSGARRPQRRRADLSAGRQARWKQPCKTTTSNRVARSVVSLVLVSLAGGREPLATPPPSTVFCRGRARGLLGWRSLGTGAESAVAEELRRASKRSDTPDPAPAGASARSRSRPGAACADFGGRDRPRGAGVGDGVKTRAPSSRIPTRPGCRGVTGTRTGSRAHGHEARGHLRLRLQDPTGPECADDPSHLEWRIRRHDI
jgi:hypothetical protein